MKKKRKEEESSPRDPSSSTQTDMLLTKSTRRSELINQWISNISAVLQEDDLLRTSKY